MKDFWFPSHLVEIPRAECLELLARQTVGRVAYCTEGGAVVLPVNHVIGGEDVLFRTSPDSGLAEHIERGGTETRTSFQVDEFDDYTQSGWSVLVMGFARLVDPQDLPDPDVIPVPWAEGERCLLVRVRPDRITGRRLLSA